MITRHLHRSLICSNFSTWQRRLFQSSVADQLTPRTSALAAALADTDGGWRHRRALAQSITLAESTLAEDQQQAALLLTHLLEQPELQQRRHHSFRLGLAGAPGAGKSTLIEAFGTFLLQKGACQRLAVVAVDPSGTEGGSILGDKTRMTELSRHPSAFVRPAPASGALGGLSTYTDDVVGLCQVAGYDLVVIETVGLGQSEVEIAQASDMLVLLIPPSGGDDLQGVKNGIVEVADLVVVTKADGDLLPAARHTAGDYRAATQFLHSLDKSRSPPAVVLTSAVEKTGFDEIWQHIVKYRAASEESGRLQTKRAAQARYWMWKHLQNLVRAATTSDPQLQAQAQRLQDDLESGRLTPRVAAGQLLDVLQHRS